PVDEGGGDANGGAVLIVVENRNAHALAQLALDIKAFGCLDVLKVDTAECGLKAGNDVDEAIGVVFVDLDIEHVDIGELLEQNGLAFHDGLGSERPDVAQPEHGGAVGDDTHQVAAPRVLKGVLRVVDDFFACRSHPGRIGERQVALTGKLLGGRDGDL